MIKLQTLSLVLLLSASFACASTQSADDDGGATAATSTTHDGLELVKHGRHTRLYVRPGASLAPYDRIEMLDCMVAFQKNWARDQNADRASLDSRISKHDMERIKTEVAKEFARIFTKELQEKGGYTVIAAGEKATQGAEDVLLLRPAIIDLDVSAPDTMDASRSRSYASSAISMTLYLEFYDSVTGQIIARYADAEGDSDSRLEVANVVTNKAAADRILERWARKLRKGLDDAHAHGAGAAK